MFTPFLFTPVFISYTPKNIPSKPLTLELMETLDICSRKKAIIKECPYSQKNEED
jgi:hypothetical protein